MSKVAHSEHLKGIIPAKVVEDELRSEKSLTMALLGLIAEGPSSLHGSEGSSAVGGQRPLMPLAR